MEKSESEWHYLAHSIDQYSSDKSYVLAETILSLTMISVDNNQLVF